MSVEELRLENEQLRNALVEKQSAFHAACELLTHEMEKNERLRVLNLELQAQRARDAARYQEFYQQIIHGLEMRIEVLKAYIGL